MDISGMAWGPDVNDFYPVRDWEKLAASGATFFAAKVTEGTSYVAKTFRQHRDGFRQHMTKATAAVWYHFFRCEKDPRDQAENFAKAVGPLGPHEMLCLDFEAQSYVQIEPKVMLVHGLEMLEAFFARLDELGAGGGMRPLIYTASRHWQAIGDPAWPRVDERGVGLWVARYHKPEPEPPLVLPSPWKSWDIWQWTDGGKLGLAHTVPGVGACDCNVMAAKIE